MHSTQLHIMLTLKARSPRRYAELRPKKIEGNVFTYHLARVIAAGLVEKITAGYALTVAGQHFVTTLASSTVRPAWIQPRVLVEIACHDSVGEWLLFRWNEEPFRGLAGFPAGKIRQGETVIESARRVLLERTGLEARIEHVGNLYSTTYKKGELLSQLLTHVCFGEVIGGKLRTAGESGEPFWYEPKKESLEGPEYFPGLAKAIWHVENRPREGQFFGEYVYGY